MRKSILIPLILLFTLSLRGQQSKVQSAYIYHFTKYMEWPIDKQTGDFVIGVIGDSPIIPHLKTLASAKMAGMQKIVIKEFSSVTEVGNCHMLFLSQKKSSEFSAVITKAKEINALVITAKVGYAKKGSGINFVTSEGKSRFEINEASIGKSDIKVSAKLVQMSIRI